MAENRLARETSPYLLQHKDNPVDWWPWGAEALEAARQFLTGAVPRPGASAGIGLGLADPARLFLVPGNHDRYAGRYLPISNQITNFESVFGDRFGNRGRPRAAGWRRRSAIAMSSGSSRARSIRT